MTAPALVFPDLSGPDRLLRALGRVTAPDPILTVSEWADRYRILSPVGSSRPGPWDTGRVPYAKAIMDALSPASPWEIVVFCASSQVSKTEIGLNWIGYSIDQNPGPILFVQPTVNTVKRFSKQRIEPTIEVNPRLRAKVRPARKRDSGNTRLSKEFPNGLLIMTGANSAAELASMPARDTVLDEVDRFPRDVEGEGDPIELARVRQETFQGKTFMCSTPTVKGLSRIMTALEQCDVQMEFRVPCPECGHRQALVFEQLKWPEGNTDQTTYECVGCQARISHAKKRWMVKNGAWARLRDNGRQESIGFHISQLYTLLGKTTWATVAKKYEAAKGKTELLRVFTNTVLGLPFAEQHEAPNWRRLYDRREPYPIGVVPPGVLFLTAGVDVQRNPARVELEIVGWGRNKERWSIDYLVIPAEVTTPDALRGVLDPILAKDWPCADGGTLPIRVMAVDSGWSQESVCAWARKHRRPAAGPAGVAAPQPRTVMVVKGAGDWGPVVRAPHKVNAAEKRRGLKLFMVGTLIAKRDTYDSLNLEAPTDRELAAGARFPPAYHHFPMYEEGFFRQITSAKLVTRYNRRGEASQAFEKDPNVPDEALDAMVYSRAAAIAYGLDRFEDAAWTRLERERGVVDRPMPFAGSAPTPASAVSTQSSAPAAMAPVSAPKRPFRGIRSGLL